jgi:hypothetical protein
LRLNIHPSTKYNGKENQFDFSGFHGIKVRASSHNE